MFSAAQKSLLEREMLLSPGVRLFLSNNSNCWSFIKWQKSNPLPIQTNVCLLAANRKTSAMCHVLCSKGAELGSLKADTSFVAMTVMVIYTQLQRVYLG